MSDRGVLGLLGLLLALIGIGDRQPRGGGGNGGSPAPPLLPTGTTPAPWPQVVPGDLPRFPGSGWEYDEPPPKAVQQRAGQLLTQLWRSGAGTFKTEQTAGRWITYRAEKVRSGKQGVVAYRLKSGTTTAQPPGGLEQSRRAPAPAPAQPRMVTSPGLPQAPGRPTAPSLPGMQTAATAAPRIVSPLAMPVLKYGDGLKPKPMVPDVALVQQKLGIPADGRFGNTTRDAVIAFQVKTGLAPNLPLPTLRARGFGAVKEATWVKLFAIPA